jgi:hypothetical protein
MPGAALGSPVVTPAEAIAAVRRLGAELARTWPELRHGRRVDGRRLADAADQARQALAVFDEAAVCRGLATRVSRLESNMSGMANGDTTVDPSHLRGELAYLVGQADALAERLRQGGTDRAA